MSKSPNIGLTLTPASDKSKTFIKFRTELAGEDSGSNMMIIDSEIAQLGVTVGADKLNGIDNKSDEGHEHNYAGSSSAGGSANSAVKLDTSAGSETQPVYFKDGKPVKTTHTLGASVPSDAKFTDTVYTHPTTSGNKHIPSGGSSGKILRWSADGTAVWGDDNDTTYDNATASKAGLMSSTDKGKLDGIETGANKTVVDTALSDSSTNPVQNKVVKAAIAGLSNTYATKSEVEEMTDTMLSLLDSI